MWAKFALAVCLAIVVNADQQQWKEFKERHGKIYATKIEEIHRYEVFKSNLKSIEQHNAKYERGEVTWYQAPNHMSDWTNAEFRRLLGALAYNYTKNEQYHVSSGVNIPPSIDWRNHKAVTEVQDQGICGACWTFSAAGTLEGLYAVKNKQLVQLSEQNLLDCATVATGYECEGCLNGIPQEALRYVRDHGIDSYAEYHYDGQEAACRQNSSILQISGYTNTVPNDENSLLDAVGSVGPVSVCMNCDLIRNYAGGVFRDDRCSKTFINHAVLAVGYGSENGQDYWLIKNSWGTTWGTGGYMKIARGYNMCGIASQPCYPNL